MDYNYYILELFVFVDDFFKALQKSKHWDTLKYPTERTKQYFS